MLYDGRILDSQKRKLKKNVRYCDICGQITPSLNERFCSRECKLDYKIIMKNNGKK